MRTRQTSGIVIAVFFIAWAAVFAVLAISSRWWLLGAFPTSAMGVIGLATELSRPSKGRGAP